MTDQAVQPDIDDAVLRDSVREMVAQSPQGLVIAVGVGALFAFPFASRTGPIVWLWYGALVLSQLAGLWAWRSLARMPAGHSWQPLRLRRFYTAQVWSAGLLLGMMAWLFHLPAYGEGHWLTLLTICGLAAGSITSYAYHLPTLYGFLALLGVPMWLRLSYLSGLAGNWVGHVVFLFYMLMLVWFARSQHRVLIGAIRMRHENRALLAQLQERSDALEAATQAKSRFFASASHDLRQPLHALGYYTTLLRPHAGDAPHVQRIQQCVNSMDGLLEGVLSISRLDAGSVERHLAPTDLHALLERLRTLYEGVATAKGLALRLRVSASLRNRAWALTDAVLAERVLGNLLGNALRYTQRGGVLLALRHQGGGALVQAQVFDTGVGISESDRQIIFDEFVQLSNPQRDVSQGVGLGLATVKRLCALLEHPIRLRSVLGHGSAFSVQMSACAEAAVQTPAAALLPLGLSGRVLLVEDDALVRDALLQTLQGWGLACDACVDGVQALEQVQVQRYDVVLSDWRLPGALNGVQLLAQIRANQPGVRATILMTGENLDDLAPAPPNMPVLRKPVRPIRLRALLGSYLDTTEGMGSGL